MYAPGHIGLALLCYAPAAAYLTHRGRVRARRAGTAGVLFCAAAPDADLYVAQLMHRGVTHTLWMAIALGALGAVVGLALGRRGPRSAGESARFGAVVGVLGIGSHLAGDVVTPMGLRPLYPLSDATVTLALVYSRDPHVNVALFVVGVGAFGLGRELARNGWLTALPGVTKPSGGGASVLREGDAEP
ncbi:metal-dependent hydrolase [Halegenticoccus soli]|uniref:metal-dependent hydrolase n=1 Tax=Halegenticoccus soli TaxID=1985678 RepID=UPI000C6EE902|nr:metal-dependent hydrolase [Halegenticoccus soli]